MLPLTMFPAGLHARDNEALAGQCRIVLALDLPRPRLPPSADLHPSPPVVFRVSVWVIPPRPNFNPVRVWCSMKTNAKNKCPEAIAAFTECCKGRTLSIAWLCRDVNTALDDCLRSKYPSMPSHLCAPPPSPEMPTLPPPRELRAASTTSRFADTSLTAAA